MIQTANAVNVVAVPAFLFPGIRKNADQGEIQMEEFTAGNGVKIRAGWKGDGPHKPD